MNCFLLLPEELISPTTARICGERVRLLRASLAPHATEFKVAVLRGPRGYATIEEEREDDLSLTLTLEDASLQRDPTTLIVGISRPQTIKKVLQAATLLGAASLHFVRAASGEKSYLQASALHPELLEKELQESLAQGWDGVPPLVSIHDRFLPFVQDVMPLCIGEHSLRLLADIEAPPHSIGECTLEEPAQEVMIAIGPEAGWNDFEKEQFLSAGFQRVSLGPRILRVETAVSALLSQTQLLREQSRGKGQLQVDGS